MAQRLARKNCPKCSIEVKPDKTYLEYLGISDEEAEKITFKKGQGCGLCNGTGYKGRVALFEIMPISQSLEKMIIEGASAIEIQEQAIKEGMRTLRQEAIRYMKKGILSAEQVLACTTE